MTSRRRDAGPPAAPNSSLATLDWNTLTRAEARRLRVAAAAREKAVSRHYNAGEIGDAEYLAAANLEEDLHVYAVCGVKPTPKAE